MRLIFFAAGPTAGQEITGMIFDLTIPVAWAVKPQ
jgi:hypothetical protein